MILHTSTLAKIKLHIKLKTKCNKHYLVEKIKPVAGQTTAPTLFIVYIQHVS